MREDKIIELMQEIEKLQAELDRFCEEDYNLYLEEADEACDIKLNTISSRKIDVKRKIYSNQRQGTQSARMVTYVMGILGILSFAFIPFFSSFLPVGSMICFGSMLGVFLPIGLYRDFLPLIHLKEIIDDFEIEIEEKKGLSREEREQYYLDKIEDYSQKVREETKKEVMAPYYEEKDRRKIEIESKKEQLVKVSKESSIHLMSDVRFPVQRDLIEDSFNLGKKGIRAYLDRIYLGEEENNLFDTDRLFHLMNQEHTLEDMVECSFETFQEEKEIAKRESSKIKIR